VLVPEHPFFLSPDFTELLVAALPMTRTDHRVSTFCGSDPRSENADIRPDVPGGRVRQMGRQISREHTT